MPTRAKFSCVRVSTDAAGSNIELSVVYSEDVQSENGRFTKATPSGKIEMRVDNPEAGVQFKPGKFYYVDFSEVPNEKSDQLPS